MLLNNYKHLYDIKNFDRYKNIYVIRANSAKIDSVTYNLLNDGSLRHKYNIINYELILYFTVDEDIDISGYFKIAYGHFYNNSDDFLYKKIIHNKIHNLEVYRCNKRDLLHNSLNKYLIFSNTYKNICEQAINISKEKIFEIKSHFIKPFEISYDNDDETLIITSNENSKVAFSYKNECIYITNIKI